MSRSHNRAFHAETPAETQADSTSPMQLWTSQFRVRKEQPPLLFQTLLYLPRVTLLPYNSERPFRSSAILNHSDTLPQSSPIPSTWTLPPTPSTSPASPGVPGPPVISPVTAGGAPGKIWAPSRANATISTPPWDRGLRACPSRVAAGFAGQSWLWPVGGYMEDRRACMDGAVCTII